MTVAANSSGGDVLLPNLPLHCSLPHYGAAFTTVGRNASKKQPVQSVTLRAHPAM